MKWLHAKIYALAFSFVYRAHHAWLNGWPGARQLSFRDKVLTKVDFGGAHLTESDFRGTKLMRSNFEHASLAESKFTGAHMPNCGFERAYLEKSTFKESKLWWTTFEQSDFTNADISTAILRQVKHQIHIRNRQKEDLEALLSSARLLWNDVRRLESLVAFTPHGPLNQDVSEVKRNLAEFLGRWKVKPPVDGDSAAV